MKATLPYHLQNICNVIRFGKKDDTFFMGIEEFTVSSHFDFMVFYAVFLVSFQEV